MAGAIPAVLAVIAFLGPASSRSRLVAVLALLGDASYALYLSHPYVLQILVKIAPGQLSTSQQIAFGIVAALLCIGGSVALYRLVELPFQRLFRPAPSVGRPEGGLMRPN